MSKSCLRVLLLRVLWDCGWANHALDSIGCIEFCVNIKTGGDSDQQQSDAEQGASDSENDDAATAESDQPSDNDNDDEHAEESETEGINDDGEMEADGDTAAATTSAVHSGPLVKKSDVGYGQVRCPSKSSYIVHVPLCCNSRDYSSVKSVD